MTAVPVPRPGCGTIGSVLIRLKSQRRRSLSRTTMVPASAAALVISTVVTGVITAVSAAPHAPTRAQVCIGSPLLSPCWLHHNEIGNDRKLRELNQLRGIT